MSFCQKQTNFEKPDRNFRGSNIQSCTLLATLVKSPQRVVTVSAATPDSVAWQQDRCGMEPTLWRQPSIDLALSSLPLTPRQSHSEQGRTVAVAYVVLDAAIAEILYVQVGVGTVSRDQRGKVLDIGSQNAANAAAALLGLLKTSNRANTRFSEVLVRELAAH